MSASLKPESVVKPSAQRPPAGDLAGAVYMEGPAYRLSVQQYHAMLDAGILHDDDPVELLEGALIFKMPKDEIHAACDGLIDDLLRQILPNGWFYRNQNPVTLADSEPEPDGAVVRGDRRTYVRLGRKPGPADTAIVIEISDSSLSRDRGLKQRIYAREGIAVYWIINLIDRQIEVFSEPDTRASEPTYHNKAIYVTGQHVPVIVQGESAGQIAVDDILP